MSANFAIDQVTSDHTKLNGLCKFFLLIILLVNVQTCSCSGEKLLVISMDGFRYDYYDTYAHLLPNLLFLASNGLHAVNGMKSTFSTQTFPAHYTIATGLNEESHGLVSNTFYSPSLNKSFERNSPDKMFYGGEPIWVTAKKSNKKTGVVIWIGNSVDWHPYNPDYNLQYDPNVTLEERIDIGINLLVNGMDFAMVYLDQPDANQHAYGTFNKHLPNILVRLNKLLDKVIKTATGPLAGKLNIILLADHGLTNVTSTKTIDMKKVKEKTYDIITKYPQIVPQEQIKSVFDGLIYKASGVVCHFYATSTQFTKTKQVNLIRKLIIENSHESIIEELKKLTNENDTNVDDEITFDNLTYYLKDQIPKRWFYSDNDRIGDLVILAEEHNVFSVIDVSIFDTFLSLVTNLKPI